jgi:hypothetical protein
VVAKPRPTEAIVTVTASVRRPSLAGRRFGYLLAAAIDAVILYLVNGRPGWQTLDFLTGDTTRVLGLLNLSLVVGIVVNLVYAGYDPPWLTAAGNLVTTAIGIAVLARIWQVFPFDFGDASFDWALLVRVLLVVGVAGAAIGVVVHTVSLIRAIVVGSR